MNNSYLLFGEKFLSILKTGKQDCCELSNAAIDALCGSFESAFVLWDGMFSFARKINPTRDDAEMYQQFVDAAIKGHVNLGL